MSDDVHEQILALHNRIAQLEGRTERKMRFGKITDVDAKKQMYRQEVGIGSDGKAVKSPWIPYGQHAGLYKFHNPPSVGQQMMMLSPDGDFDQAIGIPMTWSDDNKSPSDKPDEHVVTFETKKDNSGQSGGQSSGGSGQSGSQSGGSDETIVRYKSVMNKDSISHTYFDENGKPRSVITQSATQIAHQFMDENGNVVSSRTHSADQIEDKIGDKSTVTQTASSIKDAIEDVSHEMTSDGQKNTSGKITHDGRNIGSGHKHGGVQPGGSDTDFPDEDS